jgi:hypothetical protein
MARPDEMFVCSMGILFLPSCIVLKQELLASFGLIAGIEALALFISNVCLPRLRAQRVPLVENSAIAAPHLIILLIAICPTTSPKVRGWRERLVQDLPERRARKEQVKQISASSRQRRPTSRPSQISSALKKLNQCKANLAQVNDQIRPYQGHLTFRRTTLLLNTIALLAIRHFTLVPPLAQKGLYRVPLHRPSVAIAALEMDQVLLSKYN